MEIVRDANGTATKITMFKPFDGHQHLRQGDMLKRVAPMVAKRFDAAIVMPNTIPPITTAEQLETYAKEILSSVPEGSFWPLITMYLTDNLQLVDVASQAEFGILHGIKYYPRGLTTNSDSGVQDTASLWTKGTRVYEILQILARFHVPLLIHAADGFASADWKHEGRTYRTGDQLDPYDQEPHFILNTLPRIAEAHHDLKISVEHLSTGYGVTFLRKFGGEKLGCSLTAQHLLLDRRDSFMSGTKQMGFNTHRFWWPIIQPKEHREALQEFASEGHSFVWLGSDSAPHPISKKVSDCCTGGVLMAHAGIELYAEAFEDIGCLEKLEAFASLNGRHFYGLPQWHNAPKLTLVRENWTVRDIFMVCTGPGGSQDEKVIPFRLGETVRWKLAD